MRDRTLATVLFDSLVVGSARSTCILTECRFLLVEKVSPGFATCKYTLMSVMFFIMLRLRVVRCRTLLNIGSNASNKPLFLVTPAQQLLEILQ